MQRILPMIMTLFLLSAVSPVLAAQQESPQARLQRQMAGTWQDTQGRGIRLQIRRSPGLAGIIEYRRGKGFNERSTYRVTGRDTIYVSRPKLTYRVTFTSAGMEWRLRGGKGKPRRYRRVRSSAARPPIQALRSGTFLSV